MVSEGAYPLKIVGVVATASQGRRGWSVSTGGEEGTGTKTLGRLHRRPPAGNREPCAAFSVSAGPGRGGGAGPGAEAVGARPTRGSALGAARLPVELCPPPLSLPLLVPGRPWDLGFAGHPRPARSWRPELAKEAAEPGRAGRCGR